MKACSQISAVTSGKRMIGSTLEKGGTACDPYPPHLVASRSLKALISESSAVIS